LGIVKLAILMDNCDQIMTPTAQHKQAPATVEAAPQPDFLAGNVVQCRYFFFDPRTKPEARLIIPCGGWERCTARYRVQRESFRYFALEYVAEGAGSFTCTERTTELRPGILFGYAPGCNHEISSSATEPLVKYFVDFTGRGAKRIFHSLPFKETYTTWLRHPHAIQEIFQKIVEEGQGTSNLSQRLVKVLFELLLLRIEQNSMSPKEAISHARETYEMAVSELHDNFRSLQSTTDLAKKLKITPAYLARLFQRYSGTTPHHAITTAKMTEAASLLVATPASVAQVANSVGFSDPYHFSRVFKNYYGTAPAHFRIHPRSVKGGVTGVSSEFCAGPTEQEIHL
jgi:AraC-like DNA-binding protein